MHAENVTAWLESIVLHSPASHVFQTITKPLLKAFKVG